MQVRGYKCVTRNTWTMRNKGSFCQLCFCQIHMTRVTRKLVQNMVIQELSWWKGSQAYQLGKVFSEWLSNLWLFWYQIYSSSSIRSNFTHVQRPKYCQYFEPRRGLFSRDTRHIVYELSLFKGTFGGPKCTIPIPVKVWQSPVGKQAVPPQQKAYNFWSHVLGNKK